MSNIFKDLLCSTCKVVTPKIHNEGIKFILIFALITVFFAMISSLLGSIGLILTIWCVYFFRDPERFTPNGDNLVISPADGVVSEVSKNQTPPSDLRLDSKQKWQKISVFLNVFNVHVNRIPISGKITDVNYKEGEFLNANLAESSHKNERNAAIVKTANGDEVIFVQIAGLIARRIVSDLEKNQQVKAGDRYGIIRFGSRADIYVPQNANVKILEGQIMIGGETVLAELSKTVKKTSNNRKKTVAKTVSKKPTTKVTK